MAPTKTARGALVGILRTASATPLVSRPDWVGRHALVLVADEDVPAGQGCAGDDGHMCTRHDPASPSTSHPQSAVGQQRSRAAAQSGSSAVGGSESHCCFRHGSIPARLHATFAVPCRACRSSVPAQAGRVQPKEDGDGSAEGVFVSSWMWCETQRRRQSVGPCTLRYIAHPIGQTMPTSRNRSSRRCRAEQAAWRCACEPIRPVCGL